MNSVEKGDQLEVKIFTFIESEIAAGRFFFLPEYCKVFHKKGYYSKDREKEIIFDVAVEVYLPGSESYAMLTLIECKNYGHSVPVDDAEEFFAKIQQVGAARTKGIIASSSAFQESTVKYSNSKGIGLLKYPDQENFKWILNRTAKEWFSIGNTSSSKNIYHALVTVDFHSQFAELYCTSNGSYTTNFREFIKGLFDSSLSSDEAFRSVINKRACETQKARFWIRAISKSLLNVR